KQVAGIFEDARVYRMQTEGGQLEVMVTYTLRNESSPPRTKMDNETFEVELPPHAKLEDATATGPSGMPLATSPVPTGKQNRYALVFPIRPGHTQFNVSYKIPYTGSYEFDITPDSQLSELGVLLPKSMQFSGINRTFSQDADEAGLAVFFAKSVPAHEVVKFSITGEGLAPREAQEGTLQQSAPAGNPPAESSKTLWYVSAGMVLVIAAGAFWLWRRSAAVSSRQENRTKSPVPKSLGSKTRRAEQAVSQGPAPQQEMLEALKDELFQLERDRVDGKIAQEEYEKSKAGLDALIRRQLKKTGQKN
ncbi:MAG TPA: hypothetical protein VE133_05595, partial [Candidatus Sulfotelmatobacter sp.]|nr:hypothetical protein [Candidatus Sulfotelmatobacter sp.]